MARAPEYRRAAGTLAACIPFRTAILVSSSDQIVDDPCHVADFLETHRGNEFSACYRTPVALRPPLHKLRDNARPCIVSQNCRS